MFLSNSHKFYLLLAGFLLILQGCGSSAITENKQLGSVIEHESEFPFKSTEPEVYQGEIVIRNGEFEQKWFVARNGEKRRFDVFRGNDLLISEIQTDKFIVVNHEKKIYAEQLVGQASELNIDDIAMGMFRGKDYREFDDLGLVDGLRKFKVRNDDFTKDDILIYVDEAMGLIVKQEFTGQGSGSGPQITVVYEIRNLKSEAPDSLFQIPSGYRKATITEYQNATIKNR